MHKYLVIVAVAFLVAVGGAFITEGGLPWYSTLTLPPTTPPANIFGPVWTLIYILTTTSAILLWTLKLRGNKRKNRKLITYVFIANAALNLGWSYLFFGIHIMWLAFIDILLLLLSIITLIVLLWKTYRPSAYLLLPYGVWVTFATYLSFHIMILN